MYQAPVWKTCVSKTKIASSKMLKFNFEFLYSITMIKQRLFQLKLNKHCKGE